jgi:hypothetical protein
MNNTQADEKQYLKKVVVYVLLLLVISSTSAVMSYIIFSSKEWKKEFGNLGWLIEIIRSIIISGGFVWVIGKEFSSEAKEFMNTKYTSSKLLKKLRLSFIPTVIVCSIIVIFYHSSLGPSTLALNKKIPIESIQGPYLWYLPYSLSNSIFLGIPVFFVGLYASLAKMVELRKNEITMMSELKLVTRNNELKLVTSNDDYKNICRLFEKFCLNFIESVGQYSSLFLMLILLYLFETKVGKQTLSQLGQTITWINYALVGAAMLLILVGFLFYENAFKNFSRKLFNVGYDIGDFEDKNSSRKILLRILNRHLYLWIAFLLVLVLFPAFAFIKDLK